MAADVPGEAGGIGEATGKSADVRETVVEVEVAVAEFLEAIGGAQAGWAGAENDDLRLAAGGVVGVVGAVGGENVRRQLLHL